jgi:hypothetical protein
MVGVRRSRPPTPTEDRETAVVPVDEDEVIALARRDPRAFAPL